MKIKHFIEKDIQVLEVTEAISKREVDVLKAGISTFFQRGKNEIVIDVTGQKLLPAEVVRELTTFEILARELGGHVVLAGVDSALREALEIFAKPPVVSSYPDRKSALDSFVKKKKPAPVAAAPASPEPSKHKEEVRAKEMGETGEMRERIAVLEAENKALQMHIRNTILQARVAIRSEGYVERIKNLEALILESERQKKLEQHEKALAQKANPK